MSEQKTQTEEKKNVADENAQKLAKKEADKKTQQQVDSQIIQLPTAMKTVDEYIDEMRADNLAAFKERQKWLKKLAVLNYHIFPINSANVDDPYSEPLFNESAKLDFHDVTIPQWEYYQKLKSDVEDMDRTSRTPLIQYTQAKLPAPKNYDTLRRAKIEKELEQYRYGFWIFFRGSKDQFNRGDFIFIRDRVDAAEHRVSEALPFSQKTSDYSSTSKTLTSDSIQ